MKRFYLLAVLLLANYSVGLFAMQQPQDSKDSVVITIGTEVKDAENNKGGIRNWFNGLSQNKRNALGVLALSGIALGFDVFKCTQKGCEYHGAPWEISKIASVFITTALLLITSEYRVKQKALGGCLAWLGLSGISTAGNFDVPTLGQTSVYYFLFSPFFSMKL